MKPKWNQTIRKWASSFIKQIIERNYDHIYNGVAIYSQLPIAKTRWIGYLQSTVISEKTLKWLSTVRMVISCLSIRGKKYHLSCWKCEALFSLTFWHILLFTVRIFKYMTVIRNYNEWYFMIIKETQIGFLHSFILCFEWMFWKLCN